MWRRPLEGNLNGTTDPRNCARLAQYRQPPPQRRPVARLDRLLAASVPDVALDPTLIEIGQSRTAACHPTQKTADHVEASPSALSNKPILDETRGVTLDKLPVGAILKALEQPAPAQVNFCRHHPGLRC